MDRGRSHKRHMVVREVSLLGRDATGRQHAGATSDAKLGALAPSEFGACHGQPPALPLVEQG